MKDAKTIWSARLSAWRSSGQTAAEFSKGKEFEPSTLRWWSSRLRRPSEAPAPSPTRRPLQLVRAVPTSPKLTQELVVEVGGARVAVRSGFDRALLRDVVTALGGTR